MLEKTNRLLFLFLARNTFVLEYCGEVLDHKEFKARVKEYARNKNIHYYFMALKNDEVSGISPACRQIFYHPNYREVPYTSTQMSSINNS